MPFASQKQRAFMFSQHPDIAKKWQSEFRQKGLPKTAFGKPKKSPWMDMQTSEPKEKKLEIGEK